MAAKLVALILPLGLDTFAVAAALGIVGLSREQRARVSALFVAFEAGMPLVGVMLGTPLGHVLGRGADYLAIAVLLGFGLHMLLGPEGEDGAARLLRARGRGALLLGLSISLDELAIGFTLGLLRLPVAVAVALIALQALVVTQLGLRLGARVGESLREGAERGCGVALLLLALVLLAERLAS